MLVKCLGKSKLMSGKVGWVKLQRKVSQQLAPGLGRLGRCLRPPARRWEEPRPGRQHVWRQNP